MRVDLPVDETWPEPVLPPPPTGFLALPIGIPLTDLEEMRARLFALPKTPIGVIIRDAPLPPFPATYETRPTLIDHGLYG